MATQTVTLQCMADSHVRKGSSSVYHNDAFTAAGKHTDYTMFGFFAFGAAAIPSNATIVSAAFGGTIYGKLIAADRNFIVRPAIRAWDEATVHYDTETWPLSYNTPASTAVLGDEGSAFLADITNVAKAWFGGGYNYSYGLALYSDSANSYKQVVSRTNADTSKRPYIQITFSLPESVPTLSANTLSIAAGQSLTITTNRQSTAYTHNLTWAVGAANGTIATAATTSGTWTLSAADVTAILAQLPSSTSGVCTIACATYDGASLIGTRTVTLTVTVPASVVPVISGVTLAPVAQLSGHDVQGISSVTVSYTAAAGSGASILSRSATINGATYTGVPFIHKLSWAGQAPLTITATDSRGRSSAVTNSSIIVREYSPPKISGLSVWRADAAGVAAVDGTYLRFSATLSCSSIEGANKINTDIATTPAAAWVWTPRIYNAGTGNTATYANAEIPGAPYDALSAFYVRVLATDSIGTSSEATIFIPTQFALVNFDPDGKSIKFGGVRTPTDPTGLICALNAVFENPVTMKSALSVSDAGSGVTPRSASASNLLYFGVNPSFKDTTPNWVQKGFGWAWYATTTSPSVTSKPTTYGFLINVPSGNDVHQLYLSQSEGGVAGAVYNRSGNGSGWTTSWRKLLDNTQTIPVANGGTGATNASGAIANLGYAANMVIYSATTPTVVNGKLWLKPV